MLFLFLPVSIMSKHLQAIERQDTYLHKGQRATLVNILKEKGITSTTTLEAINSIPRHFFLDPAFEKYAYEDRAFGIAAGQTISQPYTVAYQTQFLEIKKYDKVLEVGTGSAYQACVLAELGAKVYSIERQKELFDYNNHFFFLKKYSNIKRFYGDGFAGLPTYAPFDKIIVTAAAPFIPEALVEQLKDGGIMIIPVDDDNNKQQIMTKVIKLNGEIKIEPMDSFQFVPMLEGKQK